MLENRKVTAYALFLLVCATLVAPSMAVTLTPGSTSITNIANGDPVIIHGIATGHPQNGLQVWVIGKNYVKISNVQVNEDNTYSYELKSSDTRDLTSGQYLVIIQHPMMNGEFDIVYDPASGSVINRQLDSGEAIFQLTGRGVSSVRMPGMPSCRRSAARISMIPLRPSHFLWMHPFP